jgi:hypothetical protein
LLRNDQNSGQKNYYFVVSHGPKLKNYYSTSTDLPHIMVNIRQFLLSLLPVICGRPPPVFLTPTFAATVSDSSNFSHVIEVTEAEQNYKPQPRPEIGGQRDHALATC